MTGVHWWHSKNKVLLTRWAIALFFVILLIYASGCLAGLFCAVFILKTLRLKCCWGFIKCSSAFEHTATVFEGFLVFFVFIFVWFLFQFVSFFLKWFQSFVHSSRWVPWPSSKSSSSSSSLKQLAVPAPAPPPPPPPLPPPTPQPRWHHQETMQLPRHHPRERRLLLLLEPLPQQGPARRKTKVCILSSFTITFWNPWTLPGVMGALHCWTLHQLSPPLMVMGKGLGRGKANPSTLSNVVRPFLSLSAPSSTLNGTLELEDGLSSLWSYKEWW